LRAQRDGKAFADPLLGTAISDRRTFMEKPGRQSIDGITDRNGDAIVWFGGTLNARGYRRRVGLDLSM
jgi:hypothetical protein